MNHEWTFDWYSYFIGIGTMFASAFLIAAVSQLFFAVKEINDGYRELDEEDMDFDIAQPSIISPLSELGDEKSKVIMNAIGQVELYVTANTIINPQPHQLRKIAYDIEQAKLTQQFGDAVPVDLIMEVKYPDTKAN